MELFCICLQVCPESEDIINDLGSSLPLRPTIFNCVPHTTLLQGVAASFGELHSVLTSSSFKSRLLELAPLLQCWDQEMQQSAQLLEQDYDTDYRAILLLYRHSNILRTVSSELYTLASEAGLFYPLTSITSPRQLSSAQRYCFDYPHKSAFGLISPHTTIGFRPRNLCSQYRPPAFIPRVRHSGLVFSGLNEFCMTPRSSLQPIISW